MNAKTRLGWIRLYEQLGDAGLVCRRCGISRPTLRKWWRRYQAEGIVGLEERSRRPRRPAGRKIFAEQEALILELRRTRQLGIKQLRNQLLRDHGLRLSLDTLHRVLAKHGEHRLKRPRLVRKGTKRYSRPVPGDRVQMDVCKIAPALYQYTAIDDCSRWKVLDLYPRRSAHQHAQLSRSSPGGNAVSDPTHPDRSRPGVLRRGCAAPLNDVGHQVPPNEATFTTPQR